MAELVLADGHSGRPEREDVGRHQEDDVEDVPLLGLEPFGMRRERVEIGDQEEALVLLLEANSRGERAHEVTEVEAPGRPIARQKDWLVARELIHGRSSCYRNRLVDLRAMSRSREGENHRERRASGYSRQGAGVAAPHDGDPLGQQLLTMREVRSARSDRNSGRLDVWQGRCTSIHLRS